MTDPTITDPTTTQPGATDPADRSAAAARIARLNDRLRTTFTGGRVMLTAAVAALDEAQKARLFAAIAAFEGFTPEDDPYGEHDFGRVDQDGERYLWKIDATAPDLGHASADAADPDKTVRVMTIMHASDY